MGCSKSSSKREVYSNTFLPQETRKKHQTNRPPNFAPKTSGKKEHHHQKKKKNPKEVIKIPAEINEKEMKEAVVKLMKLKAGSLRR